MNAAIQDVSRIIYDNCLKHQWSKCKRWDDLDAKYHDDYRIMRDVNAIARAAIDATMTMSLKDWFRIYTHELHDAVNK